MTLSSPRKRGPITTGLWNMGPRLRGDDSKREPMQAPCLAITPG
jgi:hypothetical protein